MNYGPYIAEATLNTKATNGQYSWDKYVLDNDKWQTLELVIDKGKKDIPVYDIDGNVVKTLKAGNKIGTLISNTLHSVDNVANTKAFPNGHFAQTSLGYVSIYAIRKPTASDVMKAEKMAIEHLDQAIKAIGMPITVYMGKFKFENVAGVGNIAGTPKADFALVDENGTEVAWISHKKEGGAKAFQQYSGVSEKSGLNTDKEVQKFFEEVADIIENESDGESLPFAVYKKVKSDKLINKAIFGPMYGKAYGRENCHIIGQGEPILAPHKGNDDAFEIRWSSHVTYNGEAKKFKTGAYTAALGVTKRNDPGRKFTYKGKVYRNARVMIAPMDMFKGRRNAKEL